MELIGAPRNAAVKGSVACCAECERPVPAVVLFESGLTLCRACLAMALNMMDVGSMLPM